MEANALAIIKKLQNNGFTAYFVGGAVRDQFWNLEPTDFDIVTDALPNQVKDLFPYAKPVGAAFGVMLVKSEKTWFEVATFRSEADYQDGRRPSRVRFCDAPTDAQRRDFTINALYCDPVNNQHHDYVNSQSDLKNKTLRFIGNPDQRIEEDFLRILRAVRFKNRFGLTYEATTEAALVRHASLVPHLASEKITDELTKMIVHPSRAESFRELFEFGILSKIFPTTEKMSQTDQPKDHHSEGDVLTHTFLVLKSLPEGLDKAVYWSAFFHDFGKPGHRKFLDGRWQFPGHDDEVDQQIKPRLEQLSFSKKLQEKILWLLRYKQVFETFEEMKLSRRLHYFDHPWFEDLWQLEMADIDGCIPEEKQGKKPVIERMNRLRDNWQYSQKNGLLPSHKPEFFTGEEIILITGIKPGKKVGEVKTQMRELQLEGKLKNRVEAEAWLKILNHEPEFS